MSLADELERTRRAASRLHPDVVGEIVDMDDWRLSRLVHDVYWDLISSRAHPPSDPLWLIYSVACEEQAFRERPIA